MTEETSDWEEPELDLEVANAPDGRIGTVKIGSKQEDEVMRRPAPVHSRPVGSQRRRHPDTMRKSWTSMSREAERNLGLSRNTQYFCKYWRC